MEIKTNAYEKFLANEELDEMLPENLPDEFSISLWNVSVTQSCSYGHWNVSVELEINGTIHVYNVVSTDSIAVDDYNSNDSERVSAGVKSLLDEVFYENRFAIEEAAWS